MCGIAGELHFSQANSGLILTMERVNQRQYRRGPDSGGLFQQGPITLGHRRLKIFDLSDKAAQPMVDKTLGLALVFNGAIYNFRELREELRSLGYHFTSDSDTEVLLKAYHAWGEECLERLRGMFSFAIWERDSDRMVLARDRLGIKPLYYSSTPHGFRFASTLPALLECKDIDRSIDPVALQYYLSFHAVPEPLTLLAGVRKLPPGHVLTVEGSGAIRQRSYWKWPSNAQADPAGDETLWLAKAHDALTLAVDRQLAADVPVGILLSGGLDSSLLVALAKERHERVETFSIGFESSDGIAGDEFHYSDLVAKHFGTRHHQLFISNKELAQSLATCVQAMSEPMTSHDNIGFYLLSREVAKHVKVALSGQGADEIFAGYHWFQKVADQQADPSDAPDMLYDTLTDFAYDEYASLVMPQHRVANHAKNFLSRMCAQNGSPDLLDHLLEYESTFALANGPLGRVDNMTMASSLEARVPFLDESVIDLAASMPMELKLRGGGKHILKQLGRQLLPREVVDRPKGYFPVPALKYLKGPTLALMHDVLSPERVQARGLFQQEAVSRLLAEPEKHQTSLGASKLWQIGMLEYWLQLQGI